MTCPSPTELRKNFIFSTVVEDEDERTRLQGENKPRRLHTDPDKDILLGIPTDTEHTGVCDVELQESQFFILDPSMRPKLPLSLQSESQPAPSIWSDPPVHPSLQDSVAEALVPQRQGSWDMVNQGAGEKMQCTDEVDDKGSCIPEVVITQADELFCAHNKGEQLVVEKPRDGKQTEETERVVFVDTVSSYGDGGDISCSDQQSLKSDSISLTSEATVSGKSYGEQDCQEDDARSVTASSVTSLFQRLQMDPLEREWLRFAALGNAAALRQLLSQDPTLASKKDFITGFVSIHF
ncbi:uncharacterized protein LOC108926198 [Scleropages formosus]|uniref:uncharacterized protein LOC108926198 n=1 Tax=Scleropages formosus TaxID=113540 RepID=UPI000878C50F|nr:uncharacterized protein LOC108926198 [Scleropages formosus]